MVTVNKKSAAAIAGILLFMQSPMPAWAQDAANEVQNVPTQAEVTKKAPTEEAIEKAEKRVRELEAQIEDYNCLLYTSPSPRDKRQSRMPSSA